MENERVVKSVAQRRESSRERRDRQPGEGFRCLGRTDHDDPLCARTSRPCNASASASEYIKLRIAYPDATLKELGEAADPPLSKSAINHRVRRVEQLAQEIARKEQRG